MSPQFDELALHVGRAILAFGRLDQSIYQHLSAIYMERNKRRWQTGATDWLEGAQPDNRFTHRVRDWRKGCRALVSGDSEFMSRADALITRLKHLERQRAHLAHASVYPSPDAPDRCFIRDAREYADFSREFDKLRDQPGPLPPRSKLDALRRKHLRIEYSLDDIRALERQIGDAEDRFAELTQEAMYQFRSASQLGSGKGP